MPTTWEQANIGHGRTSVGKYRPWGVEIAGKYQPWLEDSRETLAMAGKYWRVECASARQQGEATTCPCCIGSSAQRSSAGCPSVPRSHPSLPTPQALAGYRKAHAAARRRERRGWRGRREQKGAAAGSGGEENRLEVGKVEC